MVDPPIDAMKLSRRFPELIFIALINELLSCLSASWVFMTTSFIFVLIGNLR